MISRRAVLHIAAASLSTLVPVLARSNEAAAVDGADYRFEVYKDSRSRLRWRLKAPNGRVVAVSGAGYTTKAACREGIALVQKEAATASVQDLP